MDFRVATFEDRDNIADLHAQSWRETYRGIFSDDFLNEAVWHDRKKAWSDRLSKPKSSQFVLIAEENDSLCGFICAYGNEHHEWGTLIDNLHVKEACKGRGIGKRLMSMVAEWSRQIYPGKGMYLEVLEANVAARRFYDALGAINQETKLWQPPDGGQVKELLYVWVNIENFSVDVG